MKTFRDSKNTRGKKNVWFGMCALSVFPLAAGDVFAALNCPEGHYNNGSGSCSVSSGYTPTDQDSIAQQHLNTYHANKPLFSHYRQEWEAWNKKNLGLIEQVNKPLIRQYQLLAARLAKWHREDPSGFATYFNNVKLTPPINLATDLPNDVSTEHNRNAMMSFVMSVYMQESNDFLAGQYNANLQNIARLYFQMNPSVMKSIRIDYWTKAYAPSVSGKWGFTSAYSDSVALPDLQSIYPFIYPASSNDYDFSHVEESYYDLWNNANTSPTTHKAETKKYYRFLPQPLPDSFYTKLSEAIDPKLINKVNSETFARTQSEVVGFRYNTLMRTYLSANGDKNELVTKMAKQLSAFPLPKNMTQISRVKNESKKTCLASTESAVIPGKIDLQHKAVLTNCSSGGRLADWFVINNQDKTVQLKNAFSGQCLTAPRQSWDGPLTLVCGGRVNTYKPEHQAWQWTGDDRLRRFGYDHLYSLTAMAPTDYSSAWREGRKLDVYPYDFLQGKEALRAKWSIDAGFSRSEMLNTEHYKSAEQVMQNFYALMYGFTEELPLMDRIKSVNKGTTLPIEDPHSSITDDTYLSQAKAAQFFGGLYANSNLYNQLPPVVKRFITDIRSGKPLLDAYSQSAPAIYGEIRQYSQFRPVRWNDASNKKGSLQVFENPVTGSVDVFTSRFDGNPATGNKPIPTNRRSNNNWTYVASLGNKTQIAKIIENISGEFLEWGGAASHGDIFIYDNPYSKKREFFQARFKGMANGPATYFPTNATSNDRWNYLGERDSATVLLAALANDINSTYFSYMYNLVKLNIGTKRLVANIDQQIVPDRNSDGFDYGDWTQPGVNPSVDQSGLGQFFYVSAPTVTAISTYSSVDIAALGAISNAIIGMKIGALPWPDYAVERALMWTRFEEMVRPRLNDIIAEYQADALEDAEAAPEQLVHWEVSPSRIFDDWSEGDMNPPENFQEFREEFRALFEPGDLGDENMERYLDEFAEEGYGRAYAEVGEDVIAEEAMDNSVLSTAFNALTISETNIAASLVTVDSLTSTLVGLGLAP